MGAKSGGTTTQINKVELPKWVENASQENFQFAKDIAAKPYQEYTGDRLADFSGTTTGAWDWFNNTGSNAGQPANAAATSTYGDLSGFNVGGYDASTVDPTLWKDGSLDPYLNPFIANVEDKALSSMDRSRQLSLNQNAANAVAAKSFGGSRSGIVDAVTNAETARDMGTLSANLRKAGWDSAAALKSGDVDRLNSAGVFNATAKNQAAKDAISAALGSAGVRGGAAAGLLSAGKQAEDSSYKKYLALLDQGKQQQDMGQKELDINYANWMDKQGEDERDLNMRLAALGMSPYGRTETSTKTSSGGGTDWATVGLGGLQLLGGLFGLSDDTTKTDVQKVGQLPGGTKLYAYRYKGDPKTYPKTIGVMASDIEKKDPRSVRRLPGKGGKRVVNYSNSMGW